MFYVQAVHGGSTVILPDMATIEEVRQHAEAGASLGNDVLIRAFRYTGETWPDGSRRTRFETAFSVLGGKVTEHKDVSIPRAHWGS